MLFALTETLWGVVVATTTFPALAHLQTSGAELCKKMYMPFTEKKKFLNINYMSTSSDLSNQQTHIKTHKIKSILYTVTSQSSFQLSFYLTVDINP